MLFDPRTRVSSFRVLVALVAALLTVPVVATAQPAAVVGDAAGIAEATVGWDTYRRLDALPYLSGAVQAQQYSSFDRSGGNKDWTGGCLRQDGPRCVVAEDDGAGEIDSIWFTINRGDVTALGDIRIEVDDQLVLDEPLQSVVDGEFGPPFVFPLVANATQSPGGVYIKVPMPYRNSMRVSLSKPVEYYHVTFRHFPNPVGIRTFDRSDPALDVLATLLAAGTRDPKPIVLGARTQTHTVDVLDEAPVALPKAVGPGTISALRVRLPAGTDIARVRLQIRFDGHDLVDSPIGEFFGAGLGPVDVRSLLFATSPEPGGWLSAWWPMPFADDAVVSLRNDTGAPIRGVDTELVVAPDAVWGGALSSGQAGYFTTRSHAGPTTPNRDWLFADVTGTGKFVGVSHAMSGRHVETSMGRDAVFMEGDEKVYVDGSATPQLHGTGTEDFYEGGWFFDYGKRYTLPLTGQPTVRMTDNGCPDYCATAYRLMLADSVGYRSSLRFGIEHGPTNDEQADYSSTAFLYTRP
ncbi:glycoside hydrolase family 172 protein [Nocardia sp. CS682]|uniref:glycoside hydrolase family 172 protein n=1 Tax=Nocardia sp. CS682 TaxID=1047172 RepID=UPI001F0DD176|nr:glycoside hydrolase family 172 protein [Nocardia sp. CS682]